MQSVQVNVDAQGNNIVGDAANEPSIAIDPTDPNRIAIGWRQFDSVESDFRQAGWAYSHDGGRIWTFPGSLTPGTSGSDPVLDSDADGVFYYVSINFDEMRMFRSFDAGISWEGPIQVMPGLRDKPWMSIDRRDGIGRGNIYAIWTSDSCESGFTRSTDGGAMFMQPIHTLDATWGTIAVAPGGEVYVAGWCQNFGMQGSFVVAKSTSAKDPTVTPDFDFGVNVDLGGYLLDWQHGGPNPGGLHGQVWIATDHSNRPTRGNVYLLASVVSIDPTVNNGLDVMFARSIDGGRTWSAPVRVNDDPQPTQGSGAAQWFGTMAVAPNGRIDVIWNDTRNTGQANLSELYYAFSDDVGLTWSENTSVSPVFDSHIGWPAGQSKIGDYYDMISDNGGTSVAYAATFNGEQDVYFLRIPRDCNRNTIEDPTDIADGTSNDCNGNDVPDECEPYEDCNGNEVRDICDIGAGSSEDVNLNNVPDECESTLFVDLSATGLSNGTTWGDAYSDLQDALAVVAIGPPQAAAEIWVAGGTYTPAGPDGDREATFQLYNGVAVLGGFAGDETSVDQRDPAVNETILSGDLNANDQCRRCNDNCAYALSIAGAGRFRFDNTAATTDGPEHAACAFEFDNIEQIVNDVWFCWVADFDGIAKVESCCGFVRYAYVAVYDGCSCLPSNENLLGCHELECVDPPYESFSAVAGKSYLIRIGHAYADAAESASFEIKSYRSTQRGLCIDRKPDAENSYHVVTATDTDETAIIDGFTIMGGNATATSVCYGTWIPCTSNFDCLPYPNQWCVFQHPAGGGMYVVDASPTVTNCMFSGNQASSGGAIYTSGGNPTLNSCRFSGNRAWEGGGIYCSSSATATLTNSTFWSNAAGWVGGAMVIRGFDRPSVTNCIFWENSDQTGATGLSAQISGWYRTDMSYCAIQDLGGTWRTGNIGQDPMFVDADGPDGVPGTIDDDLRLMQGSPCINTGDPAFVVEPGATDLGGNPRLQGCRVDIGAYESDVIQGLGDFDADGSVDLADLARFQICFDPALSNPEWLDACLCVFDYDDNDTIDLADFAEFHEAFTSR